MPTERFLRWYADALAAYQFSRDLWDMKLKPYGAAPGGYHIVVGKGTKAQHNMLRPGLYESLEKIPDTKSLRQRAC